MVRVVHPDTFEQPVTIVLKIRQRGAVNEGIFFVYFFAKCANFDAYFITNQEDV